MINIVLFEPEIPFNTANIVRTCVATNAKLHLIKPMGFDLDRGHPDLKRGSSNYIKDIEIAVYENFAEFEKILGNKKLFLLTRYGNKTYNQIEYNNPKEEIYIMFGKESTGITQEIMHKYEDFMYRIPMYKTMRSLNLSNCAALVTYDLLAKVDFVGLEKEEVIKVDYFERTK